MTLLDRTHTPYILLIVFIASLAPCAHAMQQAPVAPTAAPAAGAVSPAAPMTTGREAGVRPPVTSYGIARSYSLLVDSGSPTEPVLVIPAKPMDAQAIDQAVEDLSIMSRIIEKNALGEYRTSGEFGLMSPDGAFGISPWSTAGPAILFPVLGRAKPMYLGGYGAVFFVQVSSPLLPPPQTPREQPATQQEDPVWAETKRAVLEPQANVVLPQQAGQPPEPYSHEQVDTLRTALIATLKHATNIRVLEPAEWVAIVVQGPIAAPPQSGQSSSSVPMGIPAAATPTGQTMLTLRATKANVDQFAKGQLNQQQFEQRLQIVTH